VIVCCIALVALGLIYRGNMSVNPARPADMPENSQFLPTGYDLDHNERQGTWVWCEPGEGAFDKQCRVADTHGTVIYEGAFLPVRDAGSPSTSQNAQPARTQLGWVNGPVEGSPVPLIPLTDGSLLVPRDDRDALIHRWNAHPDEWQKLHASSSSDGVSAPAQ
jgi:hypothetical protein